MTAKPWKRMLAGAAFIVAAVVGEQVFMRTMFHPVQLNDRAVMAIDVYAFLLFGAGFGAALLLLPARRRSTDC